jgi:hypothetical protein
MAITIEKIESFAKKNPLMVASFLSATVGTVVSVGFGIASDVKQKRLGNALYPLALLGVWALEGNHILHHINQHSNEVVKI